MPEPKNRHQRARVRDAVVRGLGSCATEQDVVQVLYADLHPVFGYDAIDLQVLEREGWCHSLAVERGVLRDTRRQQVSNTSLGELYEGGRTSVLDVEAGGGAGAVRTSPPGAGRRPPRRIWVPVHGLGSPVGAVAYQLDLRRSVPDEELALLEEIHGSLAVVLAQADRNALTRNQALRLSALNSIGRDLSTTLDEQGVAVALRDALAQFLRVDRLELTLLEGEDRGRARVLAVAQDGRAPSRAVYGLRSRPLAGVRDVLTRGQTVLSDAPGQPSFVAVPVLEQGVVRGALAITSGPSHHYERSTVAFLEQVAHHVGPALRNTWTYTALEAQRRRLEVVNSIGRRLTSSLDRWSISRTLREELARHVDFDMFALATLEQTDAGPLAAGFVHDSGVERPIESVPLALAGPSREAYQTGRPVLVRRSPWATTLEHGRRSAEERVVGDDALLVVTRPGGNRRVAARSLVWVPVRQGDRTVALLSLQSYRQDAFDEWHVQLLEDVGAHVGLALANARHFAAAQIERRRLEALHTLDRRVATAADERQVADAFFTAARSFMPADGLLVAYLDSRDRLAGWRAVGDRVEPLPPRQITDDAFLQRLTREGVIALPEDGPASGLYPWVSPEPTGLKLFAPIMQESRVAGVLGVYRAPGDRFGEEDERFLENAATVTAIALRTVRLHRTNEVALAQSVRLQEVASLAGSDLASVATRIAEQTRAMLEAEGVACWALDDDGYTVATASVGLDAARQVLGWAGRREGDRWVPPGRYVAAERNGVAWALLPLWYGDRAVGAVGAARPHNAVDELGAAPFEFARHAAIALESARLAGETRGRIRGLEAIRGFTELDLAQPLRAQTEMGRLIADALSHVDGTLWLVEGEDLVAAGDAAEPLRLAGAERPLRRDDVGPLARLVQGAWGDVRGGDVLVVPVRADGAVVGAVTARLGAAERSLAERMTTVLAGEAGLALARLRLVAALERQVQATEAILRHSPLGVMLVGESGRVEFTNPAIERIYGLPAGEMAGRRPKEIGALVESTPVEPPEPGGGPAEEYWIHDRRIEVRSVWIPGSGGEPARLLTLHEDVTRERSLLEAKDLVLRAIGHEVRGPAAAMRATIGGLLQWHDVVETEQRESLLEAAYDQSQRLLSLVEGQLIMAQLETGRFTPAPERVPLRRVLDGTLAVLRHRFERRVRAMEIDVPEDGDAVYCDPVHLQQVLVNLVGNAMEYTRPDPVRVSARRRGDWVEVSVRDLGEGVPPERMETLFSKAGPEEARRTRGGLGLGLYLCRLVVERSLGGRVWLEETGPGGTTFCFTVSDAAPAT